MKYFAYGANMFSQHFFKQVADATVLGVAKLKGYELFFHKQGNVDGSGKANIVPSKHYEKEVYGVLYHISPRSRYLLDKAERLGYGNQDTTLRVYPQNGSEETVEGVYAFTYIAHKERVQDDLIPFSWYKELIVAGAREHGLPQAYITTLENQLCIDDPNVQRASIQLERVAQGFIS